MNRLTSEEIAQVMERLPTDVLEIAVRFEALSQPAALPETPDEGGSGEPSL